MDWINWWVVYLVASYVIMFVVCRYDARKGPDAHSLTCFWFWVFSPVTLPIICVAMVGDQFGDYLAKNLPKLAQWLFPKGNS